MTASCTAVPSAAVSMLQKANAGYSLHGNASKMCCLQALASSPFKQYQNLGPSIHLAAGQTTDTNRTPP